MKKKLILLLIVALCALSCVAVFSACNILGNLMHTHEWEEGETFAPTCEEEGYTLYTCSCGKTKRENIVDALGHDEVSHSGEAATCEDAGFKDYVTCTRCDYTTYEIIPALGHNEIPHEGKPATCEDAGFKDYVTCTRCDYTTYEIIPALGHNEISHEGKPATCEDDGWADYVTCSRCTYTTYEELPALGHDIRLIPAREATCTQTGWDEHEACSRCDYSTEYNETPIDPNNHDLTEHAALAANCQHVGWEAYESCSRCDYTTYVEIPKTEHIPSNVGSGVYCNTVCGVCGEFISSASHTFLGGKCTICGYSSNSYLDLFNSSYGYKYLGTMRNGAALQALYNAIDEEVRAFHESDYTLTTTVNVNGEVKYALASLDYSAAGLTDTEALSVWKTYRDDNPLYYWLSSSCIYSTTSIVLSVFDEYVEADARAEMTAKIYEEAEKMIKAVPVNSSAYDYALAYHDAIIDRIDYAYTPEGGVEPAEWAHSIVGVFTRSTAVCESYARAFQMLLNASGVENIFVTGYWGREAHAWNMAKMDNGGWYWFDLTWDDTPNYESGISHTYFCVTDSSFLSNHTVADQTLGVNFLYGLPERATEKYAGYINNIAFTQDELTYVVTGYDSVLVSEISKAGDVIVPDSVTYDGKTYYVTCLGGYNRYGELNGINLLRNAVTSIYIPASVKFIPYLAFNERTTIEQFTVDTANEKYCSLNGVLFTKDMTVLIKYPAGNMRTEYVIPDGVTIIAYHAFAAGNKLPYLRKLTISSEMQTAGVPDWGSGYKGNIILGEWGNIATALNGGKLIVPENNPYFKVKDGLLYRANYQTLLAPLPDTTDVVIPEGVNIESRGSFYGNSAIRTVRFSEGWEEVQADLFIYCTSLESVVLPQSVNVIGKSAFFGCSSLKSITLTENLITIGDYAFCNCISLTRIVIPDKVTSIGESAFFAAYGLFCVTIGREVRSIGDKAFGSCIKLVEIKNCSSLNIVAGSDDFGGVAKNVRNVINSESGQSYLNLTDDGYVFYRDSEVCILMGYEGDETELILPESFDGSGYVISEYAFYSNLNITRLVLGSGVEEIYEKAFMYCNNLAGTLFIPCTVKYIGEYAFCQIGGPTVYYEGTSAQWRNVIGIGAFWNSGATIYYYSETQPKYKGNYWHYSADGEIVQWEL